MTADLLLHKNKFLASPFSERGTMDYSHLMFMLAVFSRNPEIRRGLTDRIEKYVNTMLQLAHSGALSARECNNYSTYLSERINLFLAAIYSNTIIPDFIQYAPIILRVAGKSGDILTKVAVNHSLEVKYVARLYWCMSTHEARSSAFNFMVVYARITQTGLTEKQYRILMQVIEMKMSTHLSSTYDFIREGHTTLYIELCQEAGVSNAGLNLERTVNRLLKILGQRDHFQRNMARLRNNLNRLRCALEEF